MAQAVTNPNKLALPLRQMQEITSMLNFFIKKTMTWVYLSLIILMSVTLIAKAQAQTVIVTDVAFTRGTSNQGVLTLSFSATPPILNIMSNDINSEITLPQTKLAKDQLAQFDVSAFGVPLQLIETYQDNETTRIALTHTQSMLINKQRTDSQWIVTFIPKPAKKTLSNATYSGKPISLDFQDVPVRQVLQIIAQLNDFNLVTTDTVSGNVTINLQDVPWDQALAMILKIRGLDQRIEGNILLIAPQEELAARESAVLQAQQQAQNLAPLVSENVRVNYAKAEQMASLLQSSNGGILSARGSVAVDERTNTLLLRDSADSISMAKILLKELDVPVKQVLIESRMVTVRDNVDEQLGVRWGLTGRQGDAALSGSAIAASNINSGVIPELSDRLNVNLPVANAAGRIGVQIASLMDGTILDLELSALETENRGEIIASPRITVANQQEAYIEQGTEIPYVQSTSSGATSVEFKKAVLSLKVTPHITPDNRIILDLVVTQDTRGETVSTSTGPAVAIDTQEIKTQVLVENGETIVLGGIFQQISTNDVTKVPLLGDIPIVGGLFRNKVSIEQKRELLIFVTPKIVMD
jgi:type IV pilus assembly protein PilQ